MRALVLWCADWPVVAAAAEVPDVDPVDMPVAVLFANRVIACSALARFGGVRRGQRKREAQARCPDLVTLPYDPAVEARAYEPVVATVESLAPGVEVVRPGLCAVRAAGPARYFGGEASAATRLTGAVLALGIECRAGVADGVFAAALAARQGAAGQEPVAARGGDAAQEPVAAHLGGADGQPQDTGMIVPPGATPQFLGPFPVEALDRPELADLLRRLGIRTLGEFAALPARDVLARFGPDGALAHQLASGADERPVAARRPPTDLAVRRDFDPPVERVDTAAFHAKAAAEELVAGLADHGLVCTSVDISARTHAGEWLSRRWRHDSAMTAGDIADRVRWQIESWLIGAALTSRHREEEYDETERPRGFVVLRLEPVEALPAGAFPSALWGGPGEHDERARRVINRVNSLLGHGAVLVPVPSGGRGPGDTIVLAPWGDQHEPARPAEPPWPGRLPAPSPSTILPHPKPATLLDESGKPIQVSGRAVISAPPAVLVIADEPAMDVRGWAGPWPVDERWWDRRFAQRRARLQVMTNTGAWLLAVDGGRWSVEAVYD